MKIPKSITPDNIKDSVIEVRYNSNTPFEVLIGLFFKALDDTYYYTTRPVPKAKNAMDVANKTKNAVSLNIGPASSNLFFNDKVKISIHPNKIIFNCLNEYIGWTEYFVEIKKALTQMSKVEEVESYTRASARYISEYLNTSLEECVKFSFTFGMPDVKSNTYRFHSEFKIDDRYRVILNLNSDVPAITNNAVGSQEIVPASTIDIDLISDGLSLKTVEELIKVIDDVHTKEKEVFFSILKDEYLKKLNPKY